MSLKYNFIKSLGSNYLVLVFNILNYIIITPIILRRFDLELTGVYFLCSSISSFLSLGIGWLTGASLLALSKSIKNNKHEESSSIYTVSHLAYFIYGVIVSSIIMFINILFFKRIIFVNSTLDPETILTTFNYFSLFVLFNFMQAASICFLNAALDIHRMNIFKSITIVLGTITTYYFLNNDYGFEFFVAINAFYSFLLMLILLILVRINGVSLKLLSFINVKKYLYDLIKSGKHFFTFGLIQQFSQYIDVLLLTYFAGSATFAKYAIVWKLIDYLNLILVRVSETAIPFIARGGQSSKSLNNYIILSFRLVLYPLILFSAVYFIWGQYILKIWLSDEVSWIKKSDLFLIGVAAFSVLIQKHSLSVMYALGALGKVNKYLCIELCLRALFLVFCSQYFNEITPIIGVLIFQLFYSNRLVLLKLKDSLKMHRESFFRESLIVPLITWLILLIISLLMLYIDFNLLNYTLDNLVSLIMGIVLLILVFMSSILFLERFFRIAPATFEFIVMQCKFKK